MNKDFIYVNGEENKAKLIALGYKLIKSNAKGDLFIFKSNKDEALTFGLDDDIKFVKSNVLTF